MSDNPVKWTAAGLTPAGNALQAALLGTGDGLTFTRAAAADAEGVERLDLTLQSPCTVDGPKCRVPVLLTNAGVETAFTMTELRFYVRRVTDGAPTGEEILYATVTDETGDPIPTAAQSPGFTIDWAFVFQYGNASEVTVTLDPVGLVSIGMVGQPGGVAALGDNGAVPIEQGGFGGTTAQEALYNIGAEPNENLLDNAYFVGGGSQLGDGIFPINQHGKTSYSTVNQYTIDRWINGGYGNSLSVALKEDCIEMKRLLLGTNPPLQQIFHNPEILRNKKLTMSVLAKTAKNRTYFLRAALNDTEITIAPITASNDFTLFSGTFDAPDDLSKLVLSVQDLATAQNNNPQIGDTCQIKAVKLECGERQTLAKQNADGSWNLLKIPNYSETLAKCQRYLLKINYGRYRAVALNSASIFYSVPIPVSMVSKPSIVDTTKLAVQNGISFGPGVEGFELSVVYYGDNAIIVNAIKENHGFTDSNLYMGNALFSSEVYI